MTKLLMDLGYDVDVKGNLIAQEMESELKAFGDLTEQWFSDSTFLVFISHGFWDGICGTRHEKQKPDVLATNTIFQTFNNLNCPSLRGKPKVIITQVCRGEGTGLIWVQYKEGYSTDPGHSFQVCREFFHLILFEWSMWKKISLLFVLQPLISAFLERHLKILQQYTDTDNISWRVDEVGSLFIKQLIECFQKFTYYCHLEDIFRKVSLFLDVLLQQWGIFNLKATCDPLGPQLWPFT
uniref:Caspase family p20 domain-containing protein n=1 Tax=Vombatus ursinus TaxID=29139 RepID=A0A4X2LAS8_VOMUR